MSRRSLHWIWALALAVMAANALVVVWRLPVQRRLANDADAQAVQDAAQWIAPLPADARLLLLVSNQDQTHFHFSTRLIYSLVPHRIDIALNSLPPDAIARYDGILAFGRMVPVLEAEQTAAFKGWRLAGRDARASFAVSKRLANIAPLPSPSPRLPLLRVLSGLCSVAVILVLGALLSGLTLRAPPFTAWWANLAVAHLLGATAFAIVQQSCIGLVGKPLVWPIYLFVGILFPVWWRKNGLLRRSELLHSMAFRRLSFGQIFLGKTGVSEGHLAAGYTAKEFTPSQRAYKPLCYIALLLGVFTVLERMWLIELDWDALAIWQLKAKALFLDGDLSLWQHAAQFPYAHFDYPLLTPLLSWWTYRHFDAVSLPWAQADGLLFYADLLLLFAAAAMRYVPPVYALLATALLGGLPEVTLHAVSGYADLPLAVYFFGAGVFLVRALIERETAAWPLVGWMLAGVILVKNEGLLACVSAFAVVGWYAFRARNSPISSKSASDAASAKETETRETDCTDFAVNESQAEAKDVTKRASATLHDNTRTQRAPYGWLLLPGLAYLPWWLLKQRWGLANDVMQPAHPPHFTIRLLWWRMWYAILEGFGRQMLWLGPWFPAWGLLGLVLLVGSVAASQRHLALARPLWLLTGIQICGYIGIYMITPAALPAHIISSVDRLTLHVAPTLLLAALLSCFAEEKDAFQTPV